MTNAQHDVWAVGEGYERYVGRWSRLVARELLPWLAVPAGREWLDVGCGTGALSQTILQITSPARVTGVDPSDGFLASARAQITDPRAEFRQGDAQAIPATDAIFNAVVSGLVLNFIPDQAKADCRDAPRHAAGRHSRRLCVGLCRRDAAHAALLGRGRRAQVRKRASSTKASASRYASRSRSLPYLARRGYAGCGGESDRRADGLQGF